MQDIEYLDYPALRYFKSVSDSIRQSSRYEFLNFLNLETDEVGESILSSTSGSMDKFKGSVLPESSSNYAKGYKIVSFYIDPESLLSRAYVLRQDGWRDDFGLYQRMIIGAKIRSIRKYLHLEKRVFINNIVITLPSDTKVVNSKGDTVDPSTLTKTSPVTIQVPKGFNVIGIVDGQHRVFSYHEGGAFDDEIALLRKKQNLLVTGIIYPEKEKHSERTKFEAKLFLEINSNQAKAKSDLKQAIGLILNPYSSESIAKAVLNRLNNKGPLSDVFERHFYDQGKLKTSSIVSFALKPIVKTSGEDSFYSIWKNSSKEELRGQSNDDLLDEYIEFCVSEINVFVSAVKSIIPHHRWTADKTVLDRVLSVVIINGLIICLRRIILDKQVSKFKTYQRKLKMIDKFKFSEYKSSQYSRMAEALYEKHFRKN